MCTDPLYFIKIRYFFFLLIHRTVLLQSLALKPGLLDPADRPRWGLSVAWLVCYPGGMLHRSYKAACRAFIKTNVHDSNLKNIQEQPLGSDALPNGPT